MVGRLNHIFFLQMLWVLGSSSDREHAKILTLAVVDLGSSPTPVSTLLLRLLSNQFLTSRRAFVLLFWMPFWHCFEPELIGLAIRLSWTVGCLHFTATIAFHMFIDSSHTLFPPHKQQTAQPGQDEDDHHRLPCGLW